MNNYRPARKVTFCSILRTKDIHRSNFSPALFLFLADKGLFYLYLLLVNLITFVVGFHYIGANLCDIKWQAMGKNSSKTEIVKTTDPRNSSRRRAVKAIVDGVGALAAYHVLPLNWIKPIVEQIFLPAHAAVSGITLSDLCTVKLDLW